MNKKLTMVFPMAGKGSRFHKLGFQQPKYMIEVAGKSLFELSLSSVPLDICKQVIFVGLEEHESRFKLLNFIETAMGAMSRRVGTDINYQIMLLPDVTDGQAETVLKARDLMDEKDELAIYNIDTYFHSSTLRETLLNKEKKFDGVIGATVISGEDDKWSFARLNGNGFVEQTAEKLQISNYALSGFYHFTLAGDFITKAEQWICRNQRVKGEFYIAPLYNDLIEVGKQFVVDVAGKFVPLGTPEDVEVARNVL